MSDFDKKCQEDNIRVLHLLEECLHGDGKHLRFCQLIEILNGHTDYFYVEPEATFERWNKVIKQLKYEHNNIPTAGKADASR